MKSNLFVKILIAVCLCSIAVFTFTACRDKEVYAESSDFESYPEYWNGFNSDSGDIYIPDNNSTSGIGSTNNSSSYDNSTPDDNYSSELEDWTANFIEDDEETTSSEVDTDKDGIVDDKDTDDDNDGITDDKDPDDDNDEIKDEDEADYGNQGPLVPIKQ